MSGFGSKTQRVRAVRVLLRLIEADGAWDRHGPTKAACKAQDEGWPTASSGEVVIQRVAWDMWNGSGGAQLDDIMTKLDETNLDAVAGFLRAFADSPLAIDDWIARVSVDEETAALESDDYWPCEAGCGSRVKSGEHFSWEHGNETGLGITLCEPCALQLCAMPKEQAQEWLQAAARSLL